MRKQSPIRWPSMAKVLAPGQIGTAQVEHFTVTRQDADFHNLRCRINGRHQDEIEPGEYVRLGIRGELVMSDTPMERRTHAMFYAAYARGDVLIGGLGLGMIALAVARKPGVASLTVVESNPDVIALVGPSIRSRAPKGVRLTIEEGDVFTWSPPTVNKRYRRYDAIWLDIWPDVCGDDLAEHRRLRRRYRRWLRKDGRIGSWRYGELLSR